VSITTPPQDTHWYIAFDPIRGLVETGALCDFCAQSRLLNVSFVDFVEERSENGVNTAVVDVFESW
jgi:hypothetical protein